MKTLAVLTLICVVLLIGKFCSGSVPRRPESVLIDPISVPFRSTLFTYSSPNIQENLRINVYSTININ